MSEEIEFLIKLGAPVFIAPQIEPGTYQLPLRWQETKPNPAVLDLWVPGQALCMVTGHVWDVVDIDPRNGGDLALADQLEGFGRVATPSGGQHVFIPRLGIPKRQAFLPGVDLQAGDGRGHGFVYLPPTERFSKASGELKAYAWMEPPSAPTGAPPSWIRDLIGALKPVFERPSSNRSAGAELHRYASKGLANLLREYTEAEPGTGEVRAVAGIRRTLEMVNSGWIELEQAEGAWEAAREQRELDHPSGGGQSPQDWERIWYHQIQHVADRQAEPPPEKAKTPGLSRSAQLFRHGSLDPTEKTAGPRVIGRILSGDEILTLPDPEYLIDKWLELDSTVQMPAPSQARKSFVALDMGLSIAARFSGWHGYKIKKHGPVLYVALEAVRGVKKRVQAWCAHHGLRNIPNDFHLMTEYTHMDHGFDQLMEDIERYQPVLVVIDTQSRFTAGLDENSNTVMSKVMERLKQLQQPSGACILSLHHVGHVNRETGQYARTGRGASAQLGAVDIQINLLKHAETRIVQVWIEKSKDDTGDERLLFVPRVVSLPHNETSLVHELTEEDPWKSDRESNPIGRPKSIHRLECEAFLEQLKADQPLITADQARELMDQTLPDIHRNFKREAIKEIWGDL